MSNIWPNFVDAIKGKWTRLSIPNRMPLFPDKDAVQMPAPTPEEARKAFRLALTDYVARGWSIEIENEFDAVLSKKPPFRWFLKLVVFLVLLLIFIPLAIFFLLVMLIRGLTARPRRLRIYLDPEGNIQVA